MFINNFWIYWDRASHLEKLEKVFERLDESGITLNTEKIEIGFLSRRLVGHIVSNEEIGIDPIKIYFILISSFPTNKRGLEHFLE